MFFIILSYGLVYNARHKRKIEIFKAAVSYYRCLVIWSEHLQTPTTLFILL